uniref:KfrA N-terminal DNA-binding domain-containing protein n=1 Tax=Aromatoleum toluolicum TaxID=90060 RepID=A0ABX1NHM6_9RHOO|nr:hypothetical protein [Aromatoleum toluolicum]
MRSEVLKAGRTGVEESDVKSAVEALEQEGIRPTLRTIRDRLGRGSLGTIQRHLGALRPRREAAPQSLPEVPESVLKALGHWAQEAVRVRLAEMQAQLEEQSRAVETLCVDNESVTAVSHDAEEQIGELAKQLDSARRDAEVLSTARDTLQHRLGEAERRERALSDELVRAHVRAERADGVELEVARLTGPSRNASERRPSPRRQARQLMSVLNSCQNASRSVSSAKC